MAASSKPLTLETVTKKIQKIEYLENENNFLDEVRTLFHNF